MYDTIDPFWVAAREWAGRIDLAALAARAGGWAALALGDEERWVAWGVPPEVARHWAEQDQGATKGRAVTRACRAYPERLQDLPDAPPVLCVEGDPFVLGEPAVGVVGTRACTPYGAAVARHLGAALARLGLVVVSGLARGVDAHAHRATLGIGPSVAVLGHGLAHMSPTSNRRLRDELVGAGGAIVSAYPDHVRPARWTFPQRNRWIAALSDAVVVVQAPARSGALITAAEAADLGRPLYAVPGPLGEAPHAGCLQLLVDGASVVHDVEELAESLAHRFGARRPLRPAAAGRRPKGRGRRGEEEVEGQPGQSWPSVLPAAPRSEEELWRLLQGAPTVAQVAISMGAPVSEVVAWLAMLEVEGRVVRLTGHRFVPTGAPADV